MVEAACRVLGTEMRPSVFSPVMVRLAGLFIAEVRAMGEMMYEFTAPFVVDSKRIERELNLSPTPLDTGIERTVNWYRDSASLVADADRPTARPLT
jgi:nucleoside-diphosphate-sugar epimerase